MANECEVLLDFDRFTKDLYVAKKQNEAFKQAPTLADDYVQVTASEVTYTVGGSAASYDNSKGSFYDIGTTTCKQALKSVCYEVEYDADFEITSVRARLALEDISASTEFVEQKFTIEFYSIGTPTANDLSLANNNLVNRTRSGNPGYIFDRPVLAGRQHPDNAKAVLASSKGLQIMEMSPTGECKATDYEKSNLGNTVNFGVDTSVSCTLSLTVAELEDLCVDHTAAYLYKLDNAKTQYMPNWITTMYNETHKSAYSVSAKSKSGMLLGIFGNADPLDKTQWIEVISNDLPEESSYEKAEQVCTNFPTSTHYKIQWTYVGSTTNPQAKIMSAQVEHHTEPMKFVNKLEKATAKQKFAFSVTVEWQYYQLDKSMYSPPPPPIIFSVPYDVFYPFQINSAAPRSRGSSLSSLILLGLAGTASALAASVFLI